MKHQDQTSITKQRSSIITHQASNIKHPDQSSRIRVSSIKNQASSAKLQASSTKHYQGNAANLMSWRLGCLHQCIYWGYITRSARSEKAIEVCTRWFVGVSATLWHKTCEQSQRCKAGANGRQCSCRRRCEYGNG